jgi:transcriptional regulator with XRE-family HTH domain
MSPWGKAGERLTDEEAARRRQERARKRGFVRLMEENATGRAHEEWKRGRVRPFRITMALDMRGLHGPEVDEACGVKEPTVDKWEAGEVYPTWEQLNALARLTGFPVSFFTRRGEPVEGPVFMCGRGGLKVYEPEDKVLEFSHTALVIAGIREPSPTPGSADEGRLF